MIDLTYGIIGRFSGPGVPWLVLVVEYAGVFVVQYFAEYGPSFDLDVTPGYVRNLNTDAYIESIVSTVLSMSSNFISDLLSHCLLSV